MMKIRIINLLAIFICFVVATASANDVYEQLQYLFENQEPAVIPQSTSSAGIGDIDFDGVPYQVNDAVVFSNYFVLGLSAFNVSQQGQIDATDINMDTETLKLEDLVQLVRIQLGELRPDSTIDITLTGNNFVQNDVSAKRVLFNTEHRADIIWLLFEGQVVPLPSGPHTSTIIPNFDGTHTRVLMTSLAGYQPGLTQLFEYTGDGELQEAQACNLKGEEIDLSINLFPTDIVENPDILPTAFAVHQNYPNPFNNGTRIAFDLPTASIVKFEIFNLLGQTVYSLEQRYSAGTHSIAWEGINKQGKSVATGVYYYRLIADDFVASKKMILLK